jgi:hypothetical protein
MPSLGFETTIPARARPQAYALDRAATGINIYEGTRVSHLRNFKILRAPNHFIRSSVLLVICCLTSVRIS